MALRCDWVIFCRRAYFQPAEKPHNLQIESILEQIGTDTLPACPPPFMAVAHVSDFGETKLSTSLVAPSGFDATPLQSGQPEWFEYVEPYLLFRFGACAFVEEGLYRFKIIFDGEVALSATLPIVVFTRPGESAH